MGGSVPRILAREDSRLKTSRAFMSARGSSASKTTVSAMLLGSSNGSTTALAAGGLGTAAGTAAGVCRAASTSTVRPERSTSLWPWARRSRW